MFDLVRNSKIVVGIILGLLAIPFAFFGVDFYFRGGDSMDNVAEVGGATITSREFTEALQRQQEQIREQLQGQADAALLDSPQVREGVLNQLVDERVAYATAIKRGITVSGAELQAVIAATPAFRENGGEGAFSRKLYEAALRSQGMSEPMYEDLRRRNLILGRLVGTLPATGFVPASVVERLYRIGQQQRQVSQAVLAPAQFAANAKVEQSEAQAFYDANKAQFMLPERARVEYLILSLDGIQKQVRVSPEEVKQYFEERRHQFEAPEERRARHILVTIPPNASAEQKAQAKARAADLLAQAQKAPKSFAELAKKHSEDPGSAAEGGDLGFFARGRMVKPFDDAVFGMKQQGEIAGPIETQFGYHVIMLEEIKTAPGPRFETVAKDVEAELTKAQANKRFAEAAETFSNVVYEQPDSLQPAAEQFKLELQKSGWIAREGGADDPLLNNDKFLRALFTDDVIKDRRNTEAVEVAPNIIVSARVIEHEPARQRPFADVAPQIVGRLGQEKAARLAREEGEARLAKLRQGEALAMSWSAPQMVTRERRAGLHAEAAQAVFSADPGRLPAYVGAPAPDGRYVIYRISKVVEGTAVDEQMRQGLARQIERTTAQEVASATLESWKKAADVKINKKAIEKSS
jgi:peptidyl-prolyl cis-trans isomerase D